MKGILYGVGVGPGDPELMTIKAVNRIRSCPVIAIPQLEKERCSAYQIAVQTVPEIEEKQLACIDMPMTKDGEILERSHREGAKRLAEFLEKGMDVALLTLGDSSIYASSSYLLEQVGGLGYETQMVSGIPSFCAAASRLNIPLVSNSEELHILPSSYQIEEGLKLPGVKVLMKAGRKTGAVKELLRREHCQVMMVENCGMQGERVYGSLEEIPEDAGYFSLFIVRDIE